MNEKIEKSFQYQKYGEDNIKFFNNLIKELTEEYKEKGIKVNLELESEYIVYNRSDRARHKFLRWEEVPKKDDDPVPIKDKLRQVIEADLRVS